MPFKKILSSQINRKYSIRFSTPTEDITTVETFLKYFTPDCSYNIVPGFENTSLIDVEAFLLQILPLTTHLILDITLPFIQVTKKKNVIRHLGRYIIIDRILHCIRVKISDNWPKTRNIKLPISANLKHFYDQNYITNYPKQIIVGEFILATPNFKLAPLFSSELSSLLDSSTLSLLNDYYSLGCELFSIVNDLTEDKKKTLKDPFDVLKNYRRDTTIIVCSGMHLNVDSSQIYKSKSYAIQTFDRLKKIHVTKLDQTYTQTFIADLNLVKKSKRISHFDQIKMINSEIEIVECKNLRIKCCFDKIDFHAIGRFEEPMQIQEEQNQLKIKENEFLMYLWNLYVKFNNRTPFLLPLPMNKKDQILLNKILQLDQVTSLQKTDLLKFIKLDPKAKIPKRYQPFNIKTINLQKLPVNDGQQLSIYFSLQDKILTANIQKDQKFIQEVQKKVINCLGCISEEMFKTLQNQSTSEKVHVMDEDQKFIERFLKKKNPTLEMFYFEMAKYYPHTKLTQEFVQNMYESLKLIVKRQVTGSSFQAFVLKASYEDISHIFIDSSNKFFLKDGNTKNQEELEGEATQACQQSSFRTHIKKIALYILSQKKSNYTCHMCSVYFSRKLPIPYGKMCLGCSNYVCFSCLDKKTGETAQSEQHFQQCLICQNKCDCQKCIKKRYKSQGINEYAHPPRVSIFKSSSNLNNSSENIRINEEETAQKQNIKSVDNNLKSQTSQRILSKSTVFTSHSGAQEQHITIQRCWTCELQNRVERIVRFQCSECKSEKCFDCEKAQNPKRNWVLRGKKLCNRCLHQYQQTIFKESENKSLKSKIISLEHEIVLLKRERFLNPAPLVQQNNSFEECAIVEEAHEQESESNHENRYDKGGATPIFDRSNTGNRGSQSPISLSGRGNSAQLESNASFGGKNMPMNNQNKSKRRKNSSKSSGSGSNKDKKSEGPKQKNDLRQITSKRKNSSGSQKSSIASFQKKPSRPKSNSSKGSQVKSQTKRTKRDRNQSAESGQFQQSSSENHYSKQQKQKQWKKNHHQNTDQPNYNDMSRGGYRSRGDRGGSQGGYRQFENRQQGDNFKKWDNNKDNKRDNNRDFRGRNDDRRGFNRFNKDNRQGGGFSNRYNNDDRQDGGFNNSNRFNNNDRHGGYNNGGQRGKNYDNNRNYLDRNERSGDNNTSYNDDQSNNNDSKDDRNNKKDGLLFKSSNLSINNDQDMDY